MLTQLTVENDVKSEKCHPLGSEQKGRAEGHKVVEGLCLCRVLAGMPPMVAARGGVSRCVSISCLSLAGVRVHL
eukprot:COSAG02_NODE_435_length_22393_cov_18.805643_10_plen_74_part_00